jgi:hypothetical protein
VTVFRSGVTAALESPKTQKGRTILLNNMLRAKE